MKITFGVNVLCAFLGNVFSNLSLNGCFISGIKYFIDTSDDELYAIRIDFSRRSDWHAALTIINQLNESDYSPDEPSSISISLSIGFKEIIEVHCPNNGDRWMILIGVKKKLATEPKQTFDESFFE